MFNITDFILSTIKGMVGNYPDFQVREYALNWYSKGKLTEENLSEIDALINAQYVTESEDPIIEDEITEGEISEVE